MLRTRSLRTALVIALLAAGAGSALAHLVSAQPAVVIVAPPASVDLGVTESDTDIIAFDENQCEKLAADLVTDQGVIPASTYVSCHFFHLDPINNGQLLDGRALFDSQIIGVISSTNLLDDSDIPCGVTDYPTGVEGNRGLETFQPNDRYQIIAAGLGIRVQMDVPSFSDQLRVITTCCEEDPNCD